jgi:hypothetical protein
MISFLIGGNSVSSSVVAPESGGTKTYSFDLSGRGEPDSVEVSPIFVSSSGKEKVGSVTSSVGISSGKIVDVDLVIYEVDVDYFYELPMMGVVSWWKFNGDAADSVGWNDMSLAGHAYFNSNGELVLDGDNDYVSRAGGMSGLDFGVGSYSISHWFNVNTFQNVDAQTRTMQIYPCEGLASINPIITATSNPTSMITFYATDGNGASDSLNSGANSISINQWHHFVSVFDGDKNEGEIYIDGNLLGFGALNFDGVFNCNAATFTIGGRTTSYNVNGSMDDVMIFNRALGVEEVVAIYEVQGVSRV